MAYPHVSQSAAQVVTAIQGVNPSIGADAINNMLSGLAAGYTTPIGTPILFANVLVVCTTGFAFGSATQPAYSYDTSTIQ